MTVLTIVDFRWRGPLLFGTVVRGGGERVGIAWFRPGDFRVVAPDGALAPDEAEWVRDAMSARYYRG